ncbi:hypothetical protein [Robertmurraya siralis]|uniref:hypothetical protein n=1 Tax=Robertmurraya siralis TaxID=77777 RepID=UPI0010F97BBD|nr:hypothetical protein [Robertmurraya siralis]
MDWNCAKNVDFLSRRLLSGGRWSSTDFFSGINGEVYSDRTGKARKIFVRMRGVFGQNGESEKDICPNERCIRTVFPQESSAFRSHQLVWHPLKAMNLIDIADLFLRCRRVLEEPALAGSDHHPNTHPAHNHAFGRNHLLFGDECRNE